MLTEGAVNGSAANSGYAHPSNSGSRIVGVWCIVANKGVAYREVPYIMRSQSFLNFAPNITLNPAAHPLRGLVSFNVRLVSPLQSKVKT